MIHLRLPGTIGLAAVLLLVSGCASVYSRHPALADSPGPDAASVYFIRTTPTFINDFADAPVTIEFQGEKLLKLGEGVYTLIYMKPSRGELKIYNNTLFTNQMEGRRVWKERQYRFVGGRTYFIYVKQLDEEFRGIFYEPEPVNLQQAKQLAKHLKRIGAEASTHPIKNLTNVAPPGSTTKDSEPTLPENPYKREPYMLDKK